MNKGIGPLPDVSEMLSKSKEDRIVSYRRFFADLRLSRLYFHLTVLDYFSGMDNPDNKNNFSKELEDFVSYYDGVKLWLDNLTKEKNVYEEFRDQCLQEIKAIKVIIQTYEDRMNQTSTSTSTSSSTSSMTPVKD